MENLKAGDCAEKTSEGILRNVKMLQQKAAPGAYIRVLAPLEKVPAGEETMRLLQEKLAGDDRVKSWIFPQNMQKRELPLWKNISLQK